VLHGAKLELNERHLYTLTLKKRSHCKETKICLEFLLIGFNETP
jgi:hypothetical protein